jgi:integrase/recombinase XerD
LAKYPDAGVLFLSATGEALCAEWLTRTVRAYVKAGAPAKKGSCHLFRHSAATLIQMSDARTASFGMVRDQEPIRVLGFAACSPG